MIRPITAADVMPILTPVLGERFPRGTQLDEQLAALLSARLPQRGSIDDRLRSLHDCILRCLYEQLGAAMLLQLEDGRVRRIMLEDVDYLTDLCGGLLLTNLPGDVISLEELRHRAMVGGSLGAMAALLRRYGDSLPEMERLTLSRILQENGVGL